MSLESSREPYAFRKALQNMPIVTISQPESWLLQDLYSPEKLTPPIRTKLSQADFYLVRLACSFRSLHKESSIEWARFRVVLLPVASTGEQPIVFDLYPVQEIKRKVVVTLGPSLKFQEMQASLDRDEFGFEHTESVPVIGTIGTGFDPSWDYRAGPDQEVQGTKWMYLLVKAPKGMASGRALLEIEADVLVRGTRLAVKLWRKHERVGEQLKVTLWDRQAIQATSSSDSPNRWAELANLGAGLRDRYERTGELADLEAAISAYQQALRTIPPDAPDQPSRLNSLETTILSNLASLYVSQGRYEQAEELYQRVLAIREQVLGAEHPDTAAILSNLANLYYDQGRYEQAEPLFQHALAIRERMLGASHPGAAVSRNNLATLYRAQGKYEQAEILLQSDLPSSNVDESKIVSSAQEQQES